MNDVLRSPFRDNNLTGETDDARTLRNVLTDTKTRFVEQGLGSEDDFDALDSASRKKLVTTQLNLDKDAAGGDKEWWNANARPVLDVVGDDELYEMSRSRSDDVLQNTSVVKTVKTDAEGNLLEQPAVKTDETDDTQEPGLAKELGSAALGGAISAAGSLVELAGEVSGVDVLDEWGAALQERGDVLVSDNQSQATAEGLQELGEKYEQGDYLGLVGTLVTEPRMVANLLATSAGFVAGSGGVAGVGRAGLARVFAWAGSGGAKTATAIGATSLASGEQVGDDSRAMVEAMSPGDLPSMPSYPDVYRDLSKALGRTPTLGEVRESMAREAEIVGTTLGVGASALGMMVGGVTERVFAGGVKQAATSGVINTTLRETAGEALEEAGQELAGQAGAQAGTGELDQDFLSEDVLRKAGSAAVVGGTLGGVAGGGLAAAGRLAGQGRDPDAPEPAPDTVPEDGTTPDPQVVADNEVDAEALPPEVEAQSEDFKQSVTAARKEAVSSVATDVEEVELDMPERDFYPDDDAPIPDLDMDSAFEGAAIAEPVAQPEQGTQESAAQAASVERAEAERAETPAAQATTTVREMEERTGSSTTAANVDTSTATAIDMLNRQSELVRGVHQNFKNMLDGRVKPSVRHENIRRRLGGLGYSAEVSERIADVTKRAGMDDVNAEVYIERLSREFQDSPEELAALNQLRADHETYEELSEVRKDLGRAKRRISNAKKPDSMRKASDAVDAALDRAGNVTSVKEDATFEAIRQGKASIEPEQGVEFADKLLDNPEPVSVRAKPSSSVTDIAQSNDYNILDTWVNKLRRIMDSTEFFGRLGRLAESKGYKGTSLYAAYQNSIGRMSGEFERNNIDFIEPLDKALWRAAKEMGVSRERAQVVLNEYLFARHVPERIDKLLMDNRSNLKPAAQKQYDAINVALREGSIDPAVARSQFMALQVPANQITYVTDQTMSYKNYTKSTANAVVRRLTDRGATKSLERAINLYDGMMERLRENDREAMIGGPEALRRLEAYGWKYYVPVVDQETETDTLPPDTIVNPRNAGMRAVRGNSEDGVGNLTDKAVRMLQTSAARKLDRPVMRALAQVIETLDNSTVGYVVKNLRIKYENGKYKVPDELPSTKDENMFFVRNDDGSFDVIRVADTRILDVLNDRYAPPPKNIVNRASGTVTRGMANLYTALSPAYTLGVGVWRDGLEMIMSLTEFGVKDAVRGVVEAMTQQVKVKDMASFYMADAAQQARMAAEFKSSDNDVLKYMAERYEVMGINGFRSELGVDARANINFDGLSDPDGSRLTSLAPVVGRGLDVAKELNRKAQGVSTWLDNQYRDAAYRVLRKNGKTKEEAAEWVRGLMNFNQKSNSRLVRGMGDYYMFLQTSLTGVDTMFTRRLWNEGEAPTKFVQTPEGVKQVLDWKAVPGKLNKSRIGLEMGMAAAQVALWSAALGVDEDGEPEAGKIPAWRWMQTVMIPNVFSEDGDILPGRVPVQYGVQMIMRSIGAGAALVNAGIASKEEVYREIQAVLVANLVPVGRVEGTKLTDGRNLVAGLAPSAIAPFAQLLVNQNTFGSPIFREQYDTRDDLLAGVKREKDLSVRPFVNTPETFNVLANSDLGQSAPAVALNVNSPESLEHLFKSYTGFVGTSISKFARDFFKYQELDNYGTMGVLTNGYGAPVQTIQDERHAEVHKFNLISDHVYDPLYKESKKLRDQDKRDGWKGKGPGPLERSWRKDNPEYVFLNRLRDKTFKTVGSISKEIRALRHDPRVTYDPSRVKALLEERNQIYRDARHQWEAYIEQQGD